MNEGEGKENGQLYNQVMNRRLATFTLKAVKSPIEIRFRNQKVGSGTLHSIDPLTLDIIVSNYSIQGEKERADYKNIKFNEILDFTVFPRA
jgi:small nuclear ribonucleoprotein (snRNP)-like protein